MVTVEAKGWCCQDCVFLFANGELPPEMDEDETAEWLEEIEDRTRGYSIVVGNDHDEFSMSKCDTCGTTLAGDRYEIAYLSR